MSRNVAFGDLASFPEISLLWLGQTELYILDMLVNSSWVTDYATTSKWLVGVACFRSLDLLSPDAPCNHLKLGECELYAFRSTCTFQAF